MQKTALAPCKKWRDVDGILLIDKPRELSSNAILQKVKRLYQAQKAGHTGALDPLATGMLPICFGEATKFSHFLLDADKKYQVAAKLGERTNTSDAEGQLIEKRAIKVDKQDIEQALSNFRGNLMQVPTMFSALKYQGKPLYEYARAGKTVEKVARPITIFELDFVDYKAPIFKLFVHCSKGTYIRTLVDDLGEMLGCGAHVVALRRTAVANYPTDSMVTWPELERLSREQNHYLLDNYLLPIDSAVSSLKDIFLDDEQTRAIQLGQRIRHLNLQQLFGQVRLFQQSSKKFLGIAMLDERNILHPKRLVKNTVLP